MKRDFKLAVLILESMIDPNVVGCSHAETLTVEHFKEYDGNDVQYHFDMLLQGGFFMQGRREEWTSSQFESRFLSWKGHDLLQKLKNSP